MFFLDIRKNLNNFNSMLHTIENEQERYDKSRNELLEKLHTLKQKADSLESVRANLFIL